MSVIASRNNNEIKSPPKKIKIVPKHEENSSAWKNEKIPENPEYLETLLKTENPKPIKIYSIDIENEDDESGDDDDLEANSNKNNPRKSFLSEKCKISIISENAWKNFHNKTDDNQNQNRNRRKQKNFKNILKKIINCCPFKFPWVVVTISLIQIAIYIWQNSTVYKSLIFSPMRKFEIWRFLTYSLLHQSFVHLSLNILIQLIISLPLETEQGHFRVLIVYTGGVLCGSLGASIFEESLMVGASSGVYSLLISHVPHIFMNFSSLSHRYFRIISIVVLCLSDVSYSIRHCITKGNLEPKIGVVAHVCGAISGIILGFLAYQNQTSSKVILNRTIRFFCLILFVCWLAVTIYYNIEHSNTKTL